MMRRLPALLLAALILLSCGCSHTDDSHAGTVPAPAAAAEASDVQPLDVSAAESDGGGLVFAGTAEDYVACCNELYRRETGSDYLSPPSAWPPSSYPAAAHFGCDVNCRRFTEDAETWTLPDVRIYTRSGDERIAELVVSYDDHGSSEGMYKLYRDMCCRTLRTFLPEMSAESAEELFSAMFIETDDIVTSTAYLDCTAPAVLYHSGSVGVYPYFAYGENVLICFIPVTQERLDLLAASGTELRPVAA